LDALDVSE
jgi:hypothetical protein